MTFLVVAAALVVAAGSARAQERPLFEAVTLATADECFMLEPLLEDLEAFLGRATVDARLAAVVEVGDGTASFEVLRVGVPSGRRRFARLPRACADRRAVVALAIALALDESAVIAPTIEPPAPSTAQPSVRAPPSGGGSVPPGSTERVPSLGIELRAGAGVLLGSLPVPTPLIAVDVTLAPLRGLSIGVGGLVTTPVDVPIGRGVAHLDVVGGRATVCLARELAVELVSFSGCVGAWLAAARARGDGFAQNRAGTAPWLAIVVRGELSARIAEGLELFAAADGLAVPVAPALELESGDITTARMELGRAGVAFTAGLALMLR